MYFLYGFIVLLMSLHCSVAQNLIADSSFENNHYIPTEFSSLKASRTWSQPTWGTTDLFCECYKKKRKYSVVDVPQNMMGNQEAHSGTCYAGFFAFSHGNYREYLQTKLLMPLQKGKTYLFSIYVSLADYSRSLVDQLGVCFLVNKVSQDNSNIITGVKPSYINIEKTVGNDIGGWHRVSVQYAAQGGEQYLLLGSFEIHKLRKSKFKMPKDIKSQINKNSERDSYYYVDDVCLVEIETPLKKDSLQKDSSEIKPLAENLFVLDNVLFQSNEAVFMSSSFSQLDLLVDYMKSNPRFRIFIGGHTDSKGNEEANQKLSEERAKAVCYYLIAKGIDHSRIEYKGYGSIKPIASNETEEGRKQNRRVEFSLQ